jgi:hypothetical protein
MLSRAPRAPRHPASVASPRRAILLPRASAGYSWALATWGAMVPSMPTAGDYTRRRPAAGARRERKLAGRPAPAELQFEQPAALPGRPAARVMAFRSPRRTLDEAR